MLCKAEKRVEFGEPPNGAGVLKAGFGDEDVGIHRRFERAEGRRCNDALKVENVRVLDGGFVSLQDVVVEDVDLAADECGGDECEALV